MHDFLASHLSSPRSVKRELWTKLRGIGCAIVYTRNTDHPDMVECKGMYSYVLCGYSGCILEYKL